MNIAWNINLWIKLHVVFLKKWWCWHVLGKGSGEHVYSQAVQSGGSLRAWKCLRAEHTLQCGERGGAENRHRVLHYLIVCEPWTHVTFNHNSIIKCKKKAGVARERAGSKEVWLVPVSQPLMREQGCDSRVFEAKTFILPILQSCLFFFSFFFGKKVNNMERRKVKT